MQNICWWKSFYWQYKRLGQVKNVLNNVCHVERQHFPKKMDFWGNPEKVRPLFSFYMGILNNSKKVIMDHFSICFFFIKIIAMAIQLPRTSPKLVAPNIWLWKKHTFQKAAFPENPFHLNFWVKSNKAPFFTFNTFFSTKPSESHTVWYVVCI